MQLMLSGYGANRVLITRFLDQLHLEKALPEWDAILDLPTVVDVFLEVRFPTVIVGSHFFVSLPTFVLESNIHNVA